LSSSCLRTHRRSNPRQGRFADTGRRSGRPCRLPPACGRTVTPPPRPITNVWWRWAVLSRRAAAAGQV